MMVIPVDCSPLGQTLAAECSSSLTVIARLRAELASMETRLASISASNRALLQDQTTKKLLYVGHDEVARIWPGRKVLAVRAPPGSVLGIPEDDHSGSDTRGTMPSKHEISLTTASRDDVVEMVQVAPSTWLQQNQ